MREGGSCWVGLGVTLQDPEMEEEIVGVSDVAVGLGLGLGSGGQSSRWQQWLLRYPRVCVGRSVSCPESSVHGERRELVGCNDHNSVTVVV